jgi:hypothetical protein
MIIIPLTRLYSIKAEGDARRMVMIRKNIAAATRYNDIAPSASESWLDNDH